jgi:hypothetical protein
MAAAAVQVRLANRLDENFSRVFTLADRLEALAATPSLDYVIQEAARIGELQRAVSDLRMLPGGAQQSSLAQIGASERAVASDILGLDQIEGGTMIELVLPRPGAP